MNFPEALIHIFAGQAVSHSELDGFISMTKGAKVPSDKIWSPHNRRVAEGIERLAGHPIDVAPSITHCIPNGNPRIIMGWTPSQEDLFRDDWAVCLS